MTRSGVRRDTDQTELTRKRYNRIAPVYDLLEWPMEFRFRRWREELWRIVGGSGRILEIGVGTGKNIPFCPAGADITAIDISERMLAIAQRRAQSARASVAFEVADAQALPFADATFDTVVTTFVFCSVPDAVTGLREARRVLKPGGRLVMLEHVLSEHAFLRHLMHWLDPLPSHIWGAHIDRDTVANVRAAGFTQVASVDLALDVVKLIEATAPTQDASSLSPVSAENPS